MWKILENQFNYHFQSDRSNSAELFYALFSDMWFIMLLIDTML